MKSNIISGNRFLLTLSLILGFSIIGQVQLLTAQPACAVEIIQKTDPNDPSIVYLAAQAKGTAPFEYMWSTGETTQRIAVKTPGEYCVTVSDALGCTTRACTIVDRTGTSCAVEITKIQGGLGSNTGSLVLFANPKGVAPFKFEWSTGETTQKILVDSPGVYCVTMTDSLGCVARSCIEIEKPSSGRCDVTIRKVELRIPGSSGILLLASPNGQEPYTYKWSTGETGRAILVTTSGEYCVTIVDATGCEAKACIKIEITTPQRCEVEILQRTINGPLGGTLLIAMPKGQAPYKFKWSTGDLNRVIFANRPGEYCVTMVDATGCEATNCVTIGRTKPDSCGVVIIQRPSSTASGAGYQLKAVANGNAPFEYYWSTGDTTEIINVNAPGRYCVKVVDATGCVSSACIVITDIRCNVTINAKRDTANGVVYLSAEANGKAPFMYLWNTGETTQVIKVEKDGEYCVKVIDADSCEAKACFTLKTGTHDNCQVVIEHKRSNTNVGIVLIAKARGNGPIKYKWSTGEQTQEIRVVDPGRYCVEILTADGCRANACVKWDGRTVGPGFGSGGQNENEFSIYPNPASDRLVLTRKIEGTDAIVRIMRRDGQMASQTVWPAGGTEWEMDVYSLTPGAYFVQIIENDQVRTLSFFKQ